MVDGMQKDWRELCAAVTSESDHTKLSLLVQELIETLDRANEAGIPPFAPVTQSRRIGKTFENRAQSMNDFASPPPATA